MERNKEIAVTKQFDINSPAEMTKMAVVLKSHVVGHKLYSNIKGKNYAHVEGWQFAGGMLGIMPLITEVIDVSKTGETKWKATCEIVSMKDGKVMGRGFAVCSSKEGSKKSFDEYAILSMAQTRAIGKAYRNLIGWVMKLAGYEATPSEEMHKVGETPRAAATTTPVGEDSVHLCQKCDVPIDETVAKYSKRVYGKELCRDCQKESKRK